MTNPIPDSLSGWLSLIGQAEIPVFASTVAGIEALAANEETVAPRTIAEVLVNDPMMALKILSFVARHRPARRITDTETVTAAILTMGITQFFRHFRRQAIIEESLAGLPEAFAGLERVVRRAHRAARFALAFAVHRQDTDAEVIQEAALLHDFAEILLWCHAPHAALDIERQQHADPTLRSARVQREVLGVTLADLEQALMETWRLPELLRELTNDRLEHRPSVRNVQLATALARHSQYGWDNAALPDDLAAVADLLHLSPQAAWQMVRDLDEDPAQTVEYDT
jgi:HD-like signal output (HDOD) protein